MGLRRSLVLTGYAFSVVLLSSVSSTLGSSASPGTEGLISIPAGSYVPLYAEPLRKSATEGSVRNPASTSVKVPAFLIAPYPVTNAEFLQFVTSHPEWKRSAVRPLFADSRYLKDWRSDIEYSGRAKQPVTYVSWFAAKAYCKSHGQRLPTTQEWEHVARASESKVDAGEDDAFLSRILGWYARHDVEIAEVGTWKNYYGVYDMHGLIWEWVSDFNSALVTGESRGDAQEERNLFCGGGAAFASEKQKRDYAAFMRYAFRSSLEGNFSLPQLGFRCASDPKPKGRVS